MQRIAVEEHFITRNYMDYMRSRKDYPVLKSFKGDRGETFWALWNSASEQRPWYPEARIGQLCDIGENRIKEMDQAGIRIQILSFNDNIDHLSAEDGTAVARRLNDELHQATLKHPDRFAGLATLAPKDPFAASNELERAVKQLGFKGALMLPHVMGQFIDAPKYRPIFQRAAGLGVPVYIHPTYPSPDRLKQYQGYPELGGALWGYGAEAGLVAARLICSGIFDELPSLKIVLGHLGEALPFWMWRMDNRIQRPTHTTSPLRDKLKKLPSDYIRTNFYFATSGMLSQPALLCTVLAVSADRIMFAADYPQEPNNEAVQFMESAPISTDDKEKIYFSNAARVFRL